MNIFDRNPKERRFSNHKWLTDVFLSLVKILCQMLDMQKSHIILLKPKDPCDPTEN